MTQMAMKAAQLLVTSAAFVKAYRPDESES